MSKKAISAEKTMARDDISIAREASAKAKSAGSKPLAESTLGKAQNLLLTNWREARFLGLGAMALATRELRDLVDQARSEAAESVSAEADESTAQTPLQKAYVRLNEQVQSNWNLLRAMEKSLEEGGRRWLDRISPSSQQDQAEPNLQQRVQTLWQELKSQWNDLRRDMESTGKDRDLELRRQLRSRIEDLSQRSEKLLQQFGLVTKAEMESLNRRIMRLSEMLKAQLDEAESAPLMVNRRQQDRRKRKMKVDYERRLYSRRSEDRAKVA